MKPQYVRVKVQSNSEVVKGIFEMTVENSLVGGTAGMKPGQFYMMRGWNREPLLSRPVSISTYDKDNLTFLYAVTGKGTELFSKIKLGEEVEILGPLGNGFVPEEIAGNVAVVSGGIGTAPMVQLVRELRHCKVDVYPGFRGDVYAVNEMREYVENVYLSTEDGSRGYKGYVTDLLEPSKYDVVLCCGPEVMMMKVVRLCRDAGVPLYVSMEKHMACGVGACLVCTCKTKEGNKRTCKEGPVFLGDELEL